jgi:hypothetical protein
VNAIKSLHILPLLLLALPVRGAQSLEAEFRTTGNAVVAAFESERSVLQTSSAVMLNGRKELVYGVVVSPNGHVLTKASEIAGIPNLSMRIDQQT